jgi:hypothetical protein
MGACTKAAICSELSDFLLGTSANLPDKISSVSQICLYPGVFERMLYTSSFTT